MTDLADVIADQFDWKALPVPPEDMIMRCHGKAVRVSFKDDPTGSLGCSVPAGGYLHLSAGDAGFLKPDTSLGGMVSFETVRWIPLDLSIGSFVDRVIRRLMAGLANSNSTGGYALSCAGSLVAYAANTLRWGCLSGQRAVLVEAGATYLVAFQGHDSDTLTGGIYFASAPFPSAREFTAWAGTGTRYAYSALNGGTFSVTNGTEYTISTWVSSSERYVSLLGGTTAFGTGKYAVFDLLLGEVVHEVGCTATITSMAGMFRVSITTTAIATTSNGSYGVALSDGTATRIPSITTVGGETLTIFGGQVTQSTCPLSYIPTYGAAASRAADLVTAPITADVSNGVRVRGKFKLEAASSGDVVCQADDGTQDNRATLAWDGSQFTFYLYAGGVDQGGGAYAMSGLGDTIEVDLTFTAAAITGTINGDAVSKALAGAYTPPTTARIGHSAGGASIPGRILCSKFIVTGVSA